MMKRIMGLIGIILIGIPLIWIYIIFFILHGYNFAHQFKEYILNFEYKEENKSGEQIE